MPATKVIVLVAVFGAVGTITAGAAAAGVFGGVSGGAVSVEVESWEAANETPTVETTTTIVDTEPTENGSVQTTTVTTESVVDDSVSNTSSDTPSHSTESTTNATQATNSVDSSQSTNSVDSSQSTNSTDTTTATNSTATTQSTNTAEFLENGTIEESSPSGESTSADTASNASATTTDSIDGAVDTATGTRNDAHETLRSASAETLATSAELVGDAKRAVEERADEVRTVTDEASTKELLDEYEGASVTRTTLPVRVADIESGTVAASPGVEEATAGTGAAMSGSGIDAVQRASDQKAGTGGAQPGKDTAPNPNRGRIVSWGLADPGSERSGIPFSGWGGPQFRPAATAALTVLAVGFACTGAVGVITPVTGWGALARRATDSLGRSVRSSGVDRFVPLPGYSRYDDSDPLENELRREIYETVSETPGVHRARLAEQAGVSPATVRYHERVLERERLVKSEKIGGRQRLYPLGFDDVELAAALEDDATAGVLAAIVDDDPVPVSEIAARVGRCPGTVSYHLDRLEDAGLIEREGLGNTVQVRAKPPVHAAVTAKRDVARQ